MFTASYFLTFFILAFALLNSFQLTSVFWAFLNSYIRRLIYRFKRWKILLLCFIFLPSNNSSDAGLAKNIFSFDFFATVKRIQGTAPSKSGFDIQMDSNNISLLIIPVKLYFRRCGEGLAHELVEIRVTHFLLTLLLSNSPVCLQFYVSKSNIE